MDDLVFAGTRRSHLVFDPVRVADDCRNDYRPPGRVIPDEVTQLQEQTRRLWHKFLACVYATLLRSVGMAKFYLLRASGDSSPRWLRCKNVLRVVL